MMDSKRRRLRQKLAAGEFIAAPGAFDQISTRIADRLGFPALYMTGYGGVASSLGLPDAGLAGYSDMVERVGRIASATDTPLIADADTGYGGLLTVDHTVRGYEQAGASGIQLEDQLSPKKCGHTPGRRVIPCSEMVSKIKVALAARDTLQVDDVPTSVVSLPSWELFDQQPDDYRAGVLGNGVVRVAVEAAIGMGWERYIGTDGGFVGMEGFGASAPAPDLYRHFNITPEAVATAVRARL